jgi:hypothetical protein
MTYSLLGRRWSNHLQVFKIVHRQIGEDSDGQNNLLRVAAAESAYLGVGSLSTTVPPSRAMRSMPAMPR